MFKFPALALAVVLVGSGALAQRQGMMSGHSGPVTAGSGIPITGHRGGFTVSVGRFHDGPHRPFRRGFSPFAPFWFPGYYADDFGYEEPAPPAPPPAPQPAPAVQVKTEPIPDAVLLELRGNQWVKVGSFTMETPQATTPTSKAQPAPILQPSVAAKEMPPAILVFRDGHREEISSYSIIGPVIYTKANYYASGSWSRSIQIADLDLPATLKQNEQRGVKFELPSGPDEVMIRP